ncbi:hypothetical protein PVAND_001671 [Polypedilum vanderplanki]|uniref:Uncharacterized protein n=1 Tax=Polypedilum vanderplanki TaxID=319348 RepID=A0A9J6BNM8_POLVA|nr:hypothetical protein PVAND_001671 [Polypedilum vanderplanki]
MRKIALIIILIISFSVTFTEEESDIWKLVKKLSLKQLKFLMRATNDCIKHKEYCDSKQALIDYVRKLPDDDRNALTQEHADYLINEIIEKKFHLFDEKDEL